MMSTLLYRIADPTVSRMHTRRLYAKAGGRKYSEWRDSAQARLLNPICARSFWIAQKFGGIAVPRRYMQIQRKPARTYTTL
jgi:hypothetical protein